MPKSSDPEKAKIQAANLLHGRHPDPEVQKRREANLRPGRQSHGAYVAAMTAPLEAEHQARLRDRYPTAAATAAGNDLIIDISCRRALRDRFAAFIDDAGPLTLRGGKAEVQAAARELRLLLDSDERAALQLAQLEDDMGATSIASAAQIALRRGRGELPADDDQALDADVLDDDESEGD